MSNCFRVLEACCALPSERQLLGSVLVSGPASHLRGREHALREGQHAFVCASLSVFLSIVMCVRVKHAWHPWLLCRRRGSFDASKTRDGSQTASECTTPKFKPHGWESKRRSHGSFTAEVDMCEATVSNSAPAVWPPHPQPPGFSV